MKDRGVIATYLLSPSSKITNPEKDLVTGVKDLLIHILFENLLTFRDTGRVYELKGDLLTTITKNEYNVDLASLADKKFLFDFANEMYFDVKATKKKSTQGRTLRKLLNSPATMASVISTIFIQKILMTLCHRLKLLLEVRQAGNIIDQETVAIVD